MLLLFVVFDNAGVAYLGIVGVEAGMPACAALAEKIPALVQVHFKLVHALALVLLQQAICRALHERVLFVDKFLNALHDCFVVHANTLFAV
jgi:hypothetical protein